MRTTLTLDEDVATKISAEARRSGRSFKQVVNDTLRMGLAARSRAPKLPRFRIGSHETLRLRPGFNYDKPEDVFDLLDGAARQR
jgi:hypothetical protein